jgi:xylulokinase
MSTNRSDYLLGLDIGGTAVKVGLFDQCGGLVALAERAIPVAWPQPGWAEMNPRHWQEAVAAGTREVLATANLAPQRVRAVGLSNMIGTVAALDAQGQPLRPAIAYYDTRSAAEAAWLLERAPELPAITGNRVLPGNTSLASILWLREREPRVYAQAAYFATANTTLFHALTGEWATDWTNASFMGLYDFRARGWSGELAARLGFDLGRLAPVCSPAHTATLTKEAAAQLGLCASTPVALGGLDGAMSSVGAGAIHVGDAFDVSGTSEMIALCLPQPVVCPELLARWHVLPEMWTLIGAISTPGAALQWFRNTLYAPQSAADGQAIYAAMTAEAAAAPPGANSVVFLPHLMGERAPQWDPHARGVFFGLSLSATRGEMIRAILEGAAYAMRHVLEVMEARSGVRVARVITMGGASRNALWRQIKADVWGVELGVSPVREASALGAALTAGVAVGVYASYEEAVQQAVPVPTEITRPDAAQRAAYEHPYRVFRQLYPALRETMRYAVAGE